ncbi:MAG: class I SAM-dependent methyltransferase [Bernardetiaceae bacterium]|nr:class I SAM-dependent methyltransferase [Bernardetiaceae bacterium]
MSETNIDFYENIALDKFIELAELMGFTDGVDIKQIFQYIDKDAILVEVGIGYGRAISLLRKHGFEGKIYAIDRVQVLLDKLPEDLLKQITVLKQDVRNVKIPEKADVIMWMWSGILELTLEEQEQTLCRMKPFLKEGGRLFIETPGDKIKYVGQKIDEHYVRVETEWGALDAYMPAEKNIRHYADVCGYFFEEKIIYTTDKGLERVIYVLQNKQTN